MEIQGIELTNPIIVEINQELEAHLSLEGFSPNADVLFTEVEVTV